MKKKIDFCKFSSIHIGGIKEVEIIDDIKPLENAYIIGGCNNILLSPNTPQLAMLSSKFDFLHVKNGLLHVGGATKSGRILSYAKKHDLANFELMQKLPGTLGGMVKMNAGLKEWEIFNHLQKILTCKGWIEKKDIDFGYRYANIDEIIYEAVFDISYGFSQEKLQKFKQMRDNQPQSPSCGSCFKNPKGDFAGRLIQSVGLKGAKIGDMSFSQKHANFLINEKNGTFEDAVKLIKLAKKRVFEEFGVKLENEIIII